MTVLEKFEIVKFGPFRFIGKSVFASPGSGEIFGGLWGRSKEIFEAIEKLDGYFTDEIHNVAYMNWDTEKNLLGYTVGKFMKAETPVPNGLDYLDIPEQFAAKGWVRGEFGDMIASAPKLTEDAIKNQDIYEIAWSEKFVGAEVYPKENIPQDGVISVLGYYIPCKKSDCNAVPQL